MTNEMEINPLAAPAPVERKITEPVISFLKPEEASQKASEIREKLDFLKLIKNKVNNGEALSDDEAIECKRLFGNQTFEKGKIGLEIDSLENKYYQTATAGLDGASHVTVSYPTGIYYKQSEFGEQMVALKEKIKSFYHEAGITIDRASEQVASDHNDKYPNDQVGWEEGAPHARRWFSPHIEDNEHEKAVYLTYGGSEYKVAKDKTGKWKCVYKDAGVCLAPKSVCDKLREVEESVRGLIEQRAHQAFS